MTELDNKYEIFPDKKNQYRWRVKSLNNKIISVGEAYTRRADAVRGLKRAYPDVKVIHHVTEPDE